MRLVDVTGEAGMGKSRLVHQFRESIVSNNDFFLVGRCTADGGTTPFLPFVEIVKKAFSLPDSIDSAAVHERWLSGLAALGLDPDEHWPYLATLVGADAGSALGALDAEAIGVRTRASLRTTIQHTCRLMPTVLYIEDLHWIDSASLAVLSGLLETCVKERLLILVSRRPGSAQPWKPDSPCVVPIALSPLTDICVNNAMAH
jgi:predicted ATPase